MFMKPGHPEFRNKMCHAADTRVIGSNFNSIRILARVFGGVGLATVVFGMALVIIAFESAIIEF
ncbi:MAG: hypothetical protein HN377_13565 [Alphaproteobacteria bacterium]|jgi:hypothetical protein|nr:hypothetical protein [Alphaproteobacteria bacterium]